MFRTHLKMAMCCFIVILLALVGTSTARLYLTLPREGYCGEVQMGSCTATFAHKLTIEFSDYGFHSFTSTSEHFIRLEKASLNLTEVTAIQGQKKPTWFTFTVEMTYGLEKTLDITCKAYEDTEARQVVLQSGHCTSSVVYVAKTTTLMWDAPTCAGWKDGIIYHIRVVFVRTDFEHWTKKNSYAFPANINGAINVTLSAKNTCGEEIELNTTSLYIGPATGGLAPDSATEDWWIPVLSVLLFLVFLVLITIVLSLLYTHQKYKEDKNLEKDIDLAKKTDL